MRSVSDKSRLERRADRVIYSRQDDFLSYFWIYCRRPVHQAAVQASLFYFADMSEMLRPDTLGALAFSPPATVPAHSASQQRARASARLYAETPPLRLMYLKEVIFAV